MVERHDVEKIEQLEEDPFVALAAQEQEADSARDQSSVDVVGDKALEGFSLILNPRAVARLLELKKEEKNAELTLRVRIYSGGCSGYRSEFSIDQNCNSNDTESNDIEISQDGVKVVIDKISARALGASELDFVSDIVTEGFTLRIAKAHSACGCGVSFGL